MDKTILATKIILIFALLFFFSRKSLFTHSDRPPEQPKPLQTLGVINRAQASYYRHNQNFADRIKDLNIGISDKDNSDKNKYDYYTFKVQENLVISRAILNSKNRDQLSGYIGIVYSGFKNEIFAMTTCPLKIPPDTLAMLNTNDLIKHNKNKKIEVICPKKQ